MYFAKCESDGVTISNDDRSKSWLVRNRIELAKLAEALPENVGLMCSSSLDWPEDVTDNLDVIDVCNLIRGNSIRQEEINKMLEERANEHSNT